MSKQPTMWFCDICNVEVLESQKTKHIKAKSGTHRQKVKEKEKEEIARMIKEEDEEIKKETLIEKEKAFSYYNRLTKKIDKINF